MEVKQLNSNFDEIIKKIKPTDKKANQLLQEYQQLNKDYINHQTEFKQNNTHFINKYEPEKHKLKLDLQKYQNIHDRTHQKIRQLRNIIYQIPYYDTTELIDNINSIWFFPSVSYYRKNLRPSDILIIQKMRQQFKKSVDTEFFFFSDINKFKKQERRDSVNKTQQFIKQDKLKREELLREKEKYKKIKNTIDNYSNKLYNLRRERLFFYKEKFNNSFSSQLQKEKINKLDNYDKLIELNKLFIDTTETIKILNYIIEENNKLDKLYNEIKLLHHNIQNKCNQNSNNGNQVRIDNRLLKETKNFPIMIQNNSVYQQWKKKINLKFLYDLLKNKDILEEKQKDIEQKISYLDDKIKILSDEIENPIINSKMRNLLDHYTKILHLKEKQIVRECVSFNQNQNQNQNQNLAN